MRSIGPPRTSTNAVGIPSLDQFKRGFKVLPDMVLHVTLEYTVPHMGFTTALTYGGLGKVRNPISCVCDVTRNPILHCVTLGSLPRSLTAAWARSAPHQLCMCCHSKP